MELTYALPRYFWRWASFSYFCGIATSFQGIHPWSLKWNPNIASGFWKSFSFSPSFFLAGVFNPSENYARQIPNHLPQFSGMKIRCHHHLPVFCFWIPVFSAKTAKIFTPSNLRPPKTSLKLTANAPENRPGAPKRKRSKVFQLHPFSGKTYLLSPNSQPKKISKSLGLPNSHVASIVYRCSSYRPRCPGNRIRLRCATIPIRQAGQVQGQITQGTVWGGKSAKKSWAFFSCKSKLISYDKMYRLNLNDAHVGRFKP